MPVKTLVPLSEKQKAVLAYFQANEGAFTGREIADATGLNAQGIHGVMTGLIKRDLVKKGENVIMSVTGKDGLTADRSYVTYEATEAGLSEKL